MGGDGAESECEDVSAGESNASGYDGRDGNLREMSASEDAVSASDPDTDAGEK